MYSIAATAAARCELIHTQGLNNVGENLYKGGVDVPFTAAVDSWVKFEKACYTPGDSQDTCTGMCGHYTQVSLTVSNTPQMQALCKPL